MKKREAHYGDNRASFSDVMVITMATHARGLSLPSVTQEDPKCILY